MEIEVGIDHDIRLNSPWPIARSRANETHIKVGEQVESKRIGRADRRAFLGPAFALAGLSIDILCGCGVEEFLTEFEVVEHQCRLAEMGRWDLLRLEIRMS